jgi:hypothetical protein
MLSLLVGYMKLLFSKLFVTIFGLGYCGTVLGRVHSKAFSFGFEGAISIGTIRTCFETLGTPPK